jgi:hypothetical protein
MIEMILGFLILAIFIFLILKAMGSIFKGLLFFLIAFLIYYFLFPKLQVFDTLKPVGSFISAPIDKIKNIFYKIEVIAVTKSNENLIIVIKNNGFLPISNFNVKIDSKDAKIINNLIVLLPKQTGALEVEWNDNYSKIEVLTRETKAIYISPL